MAMGATSLETMRCKGKNLSVQALDISCSVVEQCLDLCVSTERYLVFLYK